MRASGAGPSPARPGATLRGGSEIEAAARRLAAIIGHGAQGAALARTLAREGARTRADLKKPAVLARLPRAAQASVLYRPARDVPLAEAEAVTAEVRRRLILSVPGVARARHSPKRRRAPRKRRAAVAVVGSVRRRAPRVKDLDFLVFSPPGLLPAARGRLLASAALRPSRAGDRLAIADTYASGARHRALILRDATRGRCYRADFFLVRPAEKPFALFHYTGSQAYNVRTRALAKKKGWLLNQYGLFDASAGPGASRRGEALRPARGSAAIRTERDLARYLGVSYREPPDRA